MRPGQQYWTLSKAFMGGSCGSSTQRLLVVSFCYQCSQMPIPNLETPLGPHLQQCECSPWALQCLCDGFGEVGRWMWAPTSANTFLHHLPLSPRLFFPVAALGMIVPSCFCGRKAVYLSQVSLSLFTSETSPVHNMFFRNNPPFWPHLAKVRSSSLNLSR